MLTMETGQPVELAMIWMHGLGADAGDMQGLAEAMTDLVPAVRHVFLNAPKRPVTLNQGYVMPAWYDIGGTELQDREDKAGIEDSASQIRQTIDQLIDEGISSSQIYLAGFSQGGAMALYTALTDKRPLAGVVALSAYLPLATSLQIEQPTQMPVFMGLGQHDPLVLPQWTEQSAEMLKKQGFSRISLHRYPMEHSVCLEEIQQLQQWLNQQHQEAAI